MQLKIEAAISLARDFENLKTAACMGLSAKHKVKGDIIILCAYKEAEGIGKKVMRGCVDAVRRFDAMPESLATEARKADQASSYVIKGDAGSDNVLTALQGGRTSDYLLGTYVGPQKEIPIHFPYGIDLEAVKSGQLQALEGIEDGTLVLQCESEAVSLALRKAMAFEARPSALAQAIGLLIAGIEIYRYTMVEW